MTLRLFTSLCCLSICLTANAQEYYKYQKVHDPLNFIELPVLKEKKKQFIIDNNISYAETKRYGFKKNGKQKKYFFANGFEFNELGQITKVVGYNNKKSFGHSIYTYHNDGQLASHTSYNRKGEVESYYKQHFNGVQRAYVKLNADMDTTVLVIRGLIKDDNTSTDYYYKKGKLKYRWVNEYDENKKLEQVTFYKGNGKVKYIWDYRCKEDGTEILKHKDTTTVCTSITDNDDGTTTYVYQNVNEKGEIMKTINRLNKSGKLEHFRRLKGVDEVMQYEYDVAYDDDDSTIMNTLSKYYKKGKLRSVTDRTYDADHYFISYTSTKFKNGEVVSESVRRYEYGENGLPNKFVKENKVDKYKGVTLYTFTQNRLEQPPMD